MRKTFVIAIIAVFLPILANAQTLGQKLSGVILLDVERNGEAWYVNPQNYRRYYLGRPADAFRLMRELGLGISRGNLATIHKYGAEESMDSYSKYEHKS